MSNDMPFNQQQYQQEQTSEKQRLEESVKRCKKCGSDLDEDQNFCPQCGEKFGGEEYVCQICNEKTTKELCPHCGKRVIPQNCTNCGTSSLFDACENCGTLLNPELAAFMEQEKPEVMEMTAEEENTIKESFNQEVESQEFKKFQERLIERQILLEERDYFNKREKRIVKVFGAQPFSIEIPDPVEEAFRMKAYAGLEKTVIERQEKLLQEEWERLFPEEKKVEVNQNGVIILKKQAEIDEERLQAELEQKREAMEKRYRELLSQVEGEVEEHRIAEEKRKEEERLRREEEERKRRAEQERIERERQKARERQRLEQEAYENRILGTYYSGISTVQITSKWSANAVTVTSDGVTHYSNYGVSFNGNFVSFSLKSTRKSSQSSWNHISSFSGSINSTGTVISGNWIGKNYMSYYKR